ncbi:MAG: acyltransferase [Tissierellia bacterium]|nr:acyltransferase [Tissierellia bacterium]MDD4781037.1 acyltransferase [Tissierellia bacterium]
MKNIILNIVDRLLIALQERKYKTYREKYNIDDSFRFNGKDIILYGEGEITLGANSYFGNYSTIQADNDCRVEVGNGCSISHNVRMYTSSKNPDYDFSIKNNVPIKKGHIIIGDFVWIGANVFINPGIHIGDNSVIGANAVVTKDVEPFGIYGGVPARLIRKKNN